MVSQSFLMCFAMMSVKGFTVYLHCLHFDLSIIVLLNKPVTWTCHTFLIVAVSVPAAVVAESDNLALCHIASSILFNDSSCWGIKFCRAVPNF